MKKHQAAVQPLVTIATNVCQVLCHIASLPVPSLFYSLKFEQFALKCHYELQLSVKNVNLADIYAFH